jgi:methyltransferase (TIGR00027 family)
MTLPNSSYLLRVGELRYIQAFCEPAGSSNPDRFVGAFLTPRQRLACRVRGALFLRRLRADPFYHYLVARTRYYDQLFLDAIGGSVACIVNIGCGSDTRAYRYAHLLQAKAIPVLECDQPQAIFAKRELAARRFATAHVRYVPLDLNSGLTCGLDEIPDGRAFVMLEGVSPYIDTPKFEALLRSLAARLRPGSVLAYDFKLADAGNDLGRSAAAPRPFRLAGERDAVAAYHQALGWELRSLETAASLTRRLLPHAPRLDKEDCLACLTC